MPNRKLILWALAAAFVAGDAGEDEIVERSTRVLGKRWRWLRPVARRYIERFSTQVPPRRSEVVQFLAHDAGFQRAWIAHAAELRFAQWASGAQEMRPSPAAAGWKVPEIESVRALAEWLRLSESELEWFADLKGIAARSAEPRLRHYWCRVLRKHSGGVRLIEAPKEFLKYIQRRILDEILGPIPVHAAVHGFVKGRSIKTFAAPHVGRRVVLRMDLKEFFPSFGGRRIQAFFRTAGYPEMVADLLGGLCTTATPRDVWKQSGLAMSGEQIFAARQLYGRPHLPQGGPSSPALANLCAYRMDCRLNGLAEAAGATYTRYADDLAFSGNETFERSVERFAARAAAIAMEGGHAVHHRKTRIMRQSVRQYLAGVVTNERVNIVRADFDRWKAILTNCVHHGSASQNRENHPAFRMHLEGRVTFVEMINAQKGARLRRIFERIEWS
ncbi:MAG TPA: reverse transcriptase family protein [Terracidiphilus sp.]|nr:reverse transcriptase family protein [Terracidiphilus sp.]